MSISKPSWKLGIMGFQEGCCMIETQNVEYSKKSSFEIIYVIPSFLHDKR